jgi:predicted RNA-binding Zn-ribbon protein involved in translation (DUF1610 family)
MERQIVQTNNQLGAGVICLNCGNKHAEQIALRESRTDYSCPVCGEFSVSAATERLFMLGVANPKMAEFVVIDGRGWLRPIE